MSIVIYKLYLPRRLSHRSFKPDDYSKTCFECQQRVCEDCASYSKLDESEDVVSTGLYTRILMFLNRRSLRPL